MLRREKEEEEVKGLGEEEEVGVEVIGVNPSYRGSCQDLHHYPISRMSLYLHSEGGVEELGVDLSFRGSQQDLLDCPMSLCQELHKIGGVEEMG